MVCTILSYTPLTNDLRGLLDKHGCQAIFPPDD
jgi:hypothetical protein